MDLTFRIILSTLRELCACTTLWNTTSNCFGSTATQRCSWKLDACRTQYRSQSGQKPALSRLLLSAASYFRLLPCPNWKTRCCGKAPQAVFHKANLSPQDSCGRRGPKVAQGPSLCSIPPHQGDLVRSFRRQHSSPAREGQKPLFPQVYRQDLGRVTAQIWGDGRKNREQSKVRWCSRRSNQLACKAARKTASSHCYTKPGLAFKACS